VCKDQLLGDGLTAELQALGLIAVSLQDPAEAKTVLQELDDIAMIVADETAGGTLAEWSQARLPGIPIALIMDGLQAGGTSPAHGQLQFDRSGDLHSAALRIAAALNWQGGD
jgi:hypothetical protein